ncbi:MAG: BrnT family toxin [Anaerolineae bacterium]|nr:BrnT family toxin [Anaerolineae bacterium]
MEIEYDPAKREQTLENRGLDFDRCHDVFNGPILEMEDTRIKYGESRFIVFGLLDTRMVVIVWTPRGDRRRIISMRKANEREQQRFREYLDRP